MREETRKGSGGNMLGGSVCAKKARQRSSARDGVRFLQVACTHFLNIQIRH